MCAFKRVNEQCYKKYQNKHNIYIYEHIYVAYCRTHTHNDKYTYIIPNEIWMK